jgi:rhamnogalacturonyl hydrolase YesR
MGPPYMAYLGVVTEDMDLLQEMIRQCELYCELLVTETGVWRHVANAPGVGDVKTDNGAWCTGNAWAAAGMVRCLATLRKSRYAAESIADQNSLVKMTADILDGTMKADTHTSGLLRNYLDDESWFGEVAGTALMAATAFRIAVLEPPRFGQEYTDWAIKKMEAVWRHIDRETGVVAPVVNSLKEGQRTPLDGVNPEGQAFVVLLFAAWRDWTDATGDVA